MSYLGLGQFDYIKGMITINLLTLSGFHCFYWTTWQKTVKTIQICNFLPNDDKSSVFYKDIQMGREGGGPGRKLCTPGNKKSKILGLHNFENILKGSWYKKVWEPLPLPFQGYPLLCCLFSVNWKIEIKKEWGPII
jgi:hypothetical protein